MTDVEKWLEDEHADELNSWTGIGLLKLDQLSDLQFLAAFNDWRGPTGTLKLGLLCNSGV